MELVDVGNRLVDNRFAVILTKFYRQVFFFNRVEKGTNLRLVTPQLITADPFVLIGVVESLHCRVALLAFQSLRTLIPAYSSG